MGQEQSLIDRFLILSFGRSYNILYDRRFQCIVLSELVIVLGNSIVSPILETLTHVYNVTPGTIGLMVSAVTAPAILLIPIAGGLADIYGRRPILIIGLVLFGCGGVGLAFTTNFKIIILLRCAQGIGYAFTLPTIITVIRDLYGGQEEATGQGLRNASGGIANMVFPVLAGILVVLGWYLPFLLYGLALPIAIAIYLWFEEPQVEDSIDVSKNDQIFEEWSIKGIYTNAYLRGLLDLMSRPYVAGILLARILFSAVIFAFLTYNSFIVTEIYGHSPAIAATLVSLWAGSYSIVSTQSGRITEAFGIVIPLVIINTSLGIGLVLFATGPSILVATLGTVCIGIGVGLGGALYRSLVSGFASKEYRAGIVSIGEVLGRVGATGTPIILGIAINQLESQIGSKLALQLAIAGTGIITLVAGVGSVTLYYLTVPSNISYST